MYHDKFSLKSKTKIDQLLRKIKEMNINRVIISSVDMRQDTVNKSKIERIFKRMYQGVIVNILDSSKKATRENECSKEGILTTIWDAGAICIKVEKFSYELEWQNTIKLKRRRKAIIIINVCRLLNTISAGIKTYRAQYEQKRKSQNIKRIQRICYQN